MTEHTELIMVRHAQVEYTPNDKERALSKEGKEQRNDVLDILLHKDIDRIYSSPYVRAIDTIKPYAELKNIDIQIIDNLRERKVSDHFIDDFKNYAIKQWADFDYKLMYGESLREVQERAVMAIDEIVRDNKGKKIVVGTHGTFLCVLLNHYDKKYDYTFWNSLKMPAIVSIKLDEHGVVNSIVETKIQNIETELENQKKRINICENGL